MTSQSANLTAPTKGDRVTIKKGAIVHSTNPSKETYVLSRSQTVTVHRHEEALAESMGYPARPAMVTWAGAGGYWCWTDAANLLPND